jgi:hypothetical protein
MILRASWKVLVRAGQESQGQKRRCEDRRGWPDCSEDVERTWAKECGGFWKLEKAGDSFSPEVPRGTAACSHLDAPLMRQVLEL